MTRVAEQKTATLIFKRVDLTHQWQQSAVRGQFLNAAISMTQFSVIFGLTYVRIERMEIIGLEDTHKIHYLLLMLDAQVQIYGIFFCFDMYRN
jgi:hypothetical protein